MVDIYTLVIFPPLPLFLVPISAWGGGNYKNKHQ